MSKVKILYVGGEDVRMRLPILHELAGMGFQMSVLGSEDSLIFKKNKIKYSRYTLERGLSPFSDRNTLKQWVELFQKEKPDIVHAFDTKPAMLVPIAARKAGVPYVVRTITGMGYVYSSLSPFALCLRLVYRILQRRASALSNMTIFQNEDDQKYFEAKNLVSKNKSVLVRGSGVSIPFLESQKPCQSELNKLRLDLGLQDSVVVLMVARLVQHKGVQEFLEAARQVRKIFPQCRFILVGGQASEGSQAVSKAMIDSYQNDVQWLGPRSDVPSILSLSDIFVLPSYYREGVPRALLEAGVFGLPLITTDMPGCRDVVRNGKEGILVKPRDSVSLKNSILKLTENKSLRDQMGVCAKKRVEKYFSLETVSNSYGKIYTKLLEDGKSAI